MAVAAGVTALEDALLKRIGKSRYDLWFFGHTRFARDGQRVVVGVPNLHFQEWLQKTFLKPLEESAREAFGRGTTVKFRIDPELFRHVREQQEQAKQEPLPKSKKGKVAVELPPEPPKKQAQRRSKKSASPTPSMFPEKPEAKSRTTVRRWHLLKEFVVGACNRVAYAAAQNVVEEPGQGANPLVIHGPVGTGKTHLLEGVFAGLRQRFPGLVVRYVTAEDFTNRFVQSSRMGKFNSFRRQFRDCDVLLLDDLHFLAAKKATVEEFLHTFDALLAAGKQLVITTDCHPRLADELPPELIDRLLGGTVWGLQPPDASTRLDILRSKAGGQGTAIPENVLKHLAARLRGNVRELEGAVRNLRHYAKVVGKPVDLPLAIEALGDLLRHAVRVVRPSDIDAAICQVLRLPGGTLQSKSRSWAVSHPRMLAIFLGRKHTAASYSELGKHFGGRNHSTAVAAEKKVRQWLSKDVAWADRGRPWKVREIIELAERVMGV